MRQYELWWASMPEPTGRRPVLLLTRTPAYEYLGKAIVVEITSSVRGIAQEVTIGRREGLRQRSVANFDNVHVVPRARLVERIGALAPGREWEVKRALGFALDWPELMILGPAEA
jgi:mRNA-degrading endonuclease toxin of MazEF toxin-antitoxin module